MVGHDETALPPRLSSQLGPGQTAHFHFLKEYFNNNDVFIYLQTMLMMSIKTSTDYPDSDPSPPGPDSLCEFPPFLISTLGIIQPHLKSFSDFI